MSLPIPFNVLRPPPITTLIPYTTLFRSAMAMGAIYQSLAHSTGILYENAASAQQQLAFAAQTATNQGVIQIYSVDTMAGAVSAAKLAQSDVPDNMLSVLSALKATGSHPT